MASTAASTEIVEMFGGSTLNATSLWLLTQDCKARKTPSTFHNDKEMPPEQVKRSLFELTVSTQGGKKSLLARLDMKNRFFTITLPCELILATCRVYLLDESNKRIPMFVTVSKGERVEVPYLVPIYSTLRKADQTHGSTNVQQMQIELTYPKNGDQVCIFDWASVHLQKIRFMVVGQSVQSQVEVAFVSNERVLVLTDQDVKAPKQAKRKSSSTCKQEGAGQINHQGGTGESKCKAAKCDDGLQEKADADLVSTSDLTRDTLPFPVTLETGSEDESVFGASELDGTVSGTCNHGPCSWPSLSAVSSESDEDGLMPFDDVGVLGTSGDMGKFEGFFQPPSKQPCRGDACFFDVQLQSLWQANPFHDTNTNILNTVLDSDSHLGFDVKANPAISPVNVGNAMDQLKDIASTHQDALVDSDIFHNFPDAFSDAFSPSSLFTTALTQV
eukprot:m.306470 g.306470  ORF g.306470 m.306470 type:complete len:445 (+) comp15923_c0_seq1:361-1695(+)